MSHYDYDHSFGYMGFVSTDEQDYDAGYKALRFFHMRSQEYPNYNFTIDDLIASLGNQPTIKVQGIGLAANAMDISEQKMEEAMYALADIAQGKIPTNFMTYTQAMSNKLSNPTFTEAVKYTAVETAKDVAEGTVEIAQNVGDTVLNVGKGVLSTANIVSKLIPVILIGGIGIILWSYSSKIKTAMRLGRKKEFGV